MAKKVIKEKKDVDDTKIKKYGWGVRHVQMLCMWLNMVSLFTVRSAMGVAVLAMTNSKYQRDGVEIYSWNKKMQGVVLSSFFWGYMVMQIPAGILSKRFGGKPILMVALVANAVIFALLPSLAKLGGWQAVCGARVFMGLTQACLYPASHTLLGRWLPAHERTSLMGMVYGGSMVGMIISLPLSGLLVGTAMGWKLIFYFLAGLMALVAAIWWALAASSPAEHRLMSREELEYIEADLNSGPKGSNHLRTPWRAIAKSVSVWAVTAAHFGMCGIFVLFFVDMPTYMEKGLGISLKNSAILSAIPYVGMAIGNNVSTFVCQKMYNRRLLSLTACRKLFNSISFYLPAMGLVVLSFLGPEQRYLAFATLVVILTFKGFCSAGFLVNHLDLSPNFAGVLLSITNFIANLNSIVTPLLTGIILKDDPSDVSRWRIVFLTVAAINVVSNTLYVIFGSAEKQPWDHPDFSIKGNDPEEMKPALGAEKEKEASKHS